MKKLLPLLLAALLVFASACSILKPDDAPADATATPTAASSLEPSATPAATPGDISGEEEDLSGTYFNTFLGLSVDLPENWTVYALDKDNLSKDKTKTAKETNLNIEEGVMPLVAFSNTNNYMDEDNVEVNTYAEDASDFKDLDEFLSYTQDFFEDVDEELIPYILQDTPKSTETINGVMYTFMRYLGKGETEDDNSSYIDLYIAEKKGYYVSFQFMYWADSAGNPEKAIDDYMKNNVKIE